MGNVYQNVGRDQVVLAESPVGRGFVRFVYLAHLSIYTLLGLQMMVVFRPETKDGSY